MKKREMSEAERKLRNQIKNGKAPAYTFARGPRYKVKKGGLAWGNRGQAVWRGREYVSDLEKVNGRRTWRLESTIWQLRQAEALES